MALGLMLSGCAGGSVKYVATSEPIARSLKVVCINKEDKITEKTARQIERLNLGIQSAKKRRQRCAGK